MERYQILADLPGIQIGTIFERVEGESYYKPMGDLVYPRFHRSQVENNPSWWCEIKKPKRMAPAYLSYYDDKSIQLSNAIFSSEEEALRMFGSNFKGWPALPDSEGYYPGPQGEG